jgi:diguanylate cyclase (GGDEF)-like protein
MQRPGARADVVDGTDPVPIQDWGRTMARLSTAPPRAAVAGTLAAALVCLACLTLLPAQYASPVSDVAQGVAALAASIGAGRHGGRCTDRRSRATWGLISAACLSWALGETYWCWFTLREDVVPFPSLADVGFLGFAALMAVGLLVHPVRGRRIPFLRRLFDGLMTAGSVALVSWLTTLGAVAGAGAASPVERVLLLAYPASDVLLVVLTVLLLSRAGGRQTALYLVGAGVVALGVSDSAFAYVGALGIYEGGLIDLGWIGGFLLIALAGTCPEPAPEGRRHEADSEDRGAVSASAVPYVPVVVALAVVVGLTLGDRPLGKLETLTACANVLCLLGRQYLTVRDNALLTRELTARERDLRRQAFSDSLTGLANRSLFLDRLEHVLELDSRNRRPVAVVFLDLDDFKVVNDSYGHAAGDELLVLVAGRIRDATRAGDTVARLGGDEFAVLLEDGSDPVEAGARISAALARPFLFAGGEHGVRASVGVAAVTADEPRVTADALMARSDAAMYAAKRSGNGGVASFDSATGGIAEAGPLLAARS